jgi:hypothetical protein
MEILEPRIEDPEIIGLLREVIESFSSSAPGIGPASPKGLRGTGLPLGNLTSQLFVNIYMNEFDQFMKHELRAEYYIRYADDFVIFSPNRAWIEAILPEIDCFLKNRLKLTLHPDKVSIETLVSGVDFLGWTHFFDHRVLRTATKRRMMKRIGMNPTPETLASYYGLLSHGNGRKIMRRVMGEEKRALDSRFRGNDKKSAKLVS